MPTINKQEKKSRPTERKETDMRKLRQKAYQNKEWRKLREVYMHEHPLCDECLKKGKVTPATDVHHKKSPFKGGEVNYNLLLDYDNLESVCKDCHGAIHANQQGHITPEQQLELLDWIFNGLQDSDEDR